MSKIKDGNGCAATQTYLIIAVSGEMTDELYDVTVNS